MVVIDNLVDFNLPPCYLIQQFSCLYSYFASLLGELMWQLSYLVPHVILSYHHLINSLLYDGKFLY
uniref:Uncharacterized protein n=1 Tax=Arundo donax TaxID=35708 RepID=A0A0A9GHF4_ARUDO